MRSISHKIKSYRRHFRPIPSYVFESRIFLLTSTLVLLLTASIALSVISSVFYHSTLYAHIPWTVLVCEVALLLGFVQLLIESNRRRYLRARPGASDPNFRLALMSTERERVATIEQLFGQQQNFETLACSLIERWEWYRSIEEKASNPVSKNALSFFGLPGAGNFATYMGGLLAITAAIVVTILDREVFYAHLPGLIDDVLEITWLLTKIFVFPLAVVVIPLAAIVGTIRSMAVRGREKVDDDYLSQAGFYAFIKELLELEQRKTRRLLMITTGLFYWAFRLGIAPIQDLPKLYKNMSRSKRLAKMRRKRSMGIASET